MIAASTKPIAVKLRIMAGHQVAVLYAPKGYKQALGALPPGVSVADKLGTQFDIVHAFYESQSKFSADLPKLKKAIKKSGSVWISWRKGNATDLSRDTIRKLCERVGLETVAACAIDADWSALRLMYPLDQRR